MTQKISYPFGYIQKQTLAFLAVMALVIENQKAIIEVETLTADATVNVTASDPDAGAELIMKVTADATGRTLTLGTGFLGLPVVIPASKTVYLTFVWDGVAFILLSKNQIN